MRTRGALLTFRRKAEVAAALKTLAEQAVGFGRLHSSVDSLLHEAELFQLGSRVEPVPAVAPRRLYEPVAIFPVANCRGRDRQHALNGADAVHGKIGLRHED